MYYILRSFCAKRLTNYGLGSKIMDQFALYTIQIYIAPKS